jgi:hypothetical protein
MIIFLQDVQDNLKKNSLVNIEASDILPSCSRRYSFPDLAASQRLSPRQPGLRFKCKLLPCSHPQAPASHVTSRSQTNGDEHRHYEN